MRNIEDVHCTGMMRKIKQKTLPVKFSKKVVDKNALEFETKNY